MNQFDISEAQEWQLFELLEGNLSAKEAALLHQEIESQPALAYHYNLLKQTYATAPEIQFPDAQSLKKQTRNKLIYLWTSTAVAAAIAILLLWKPISTFTNKSTLEAQNKIGQVFDKTNNSEEAPDLIGPNSRGEESKRSAETMRTAKSQATKNLAGNSVVEKIHPLITATNDFRSKRNDSQQSSIVANIGTIKIETSNSLAQHLSDQGSIGDALQSTTGGNQKNEMLPPPSRNGENKENGIERARTDKTKFAKNSSLRNNKLALAKSFINDGKTMIQNGHIPHVNIKTISKSNSLIPTIEMGVRLENNVILASFN